jgi:hypothetical protein
VERIIEDADGGAANFLEFADVGCERMEMADRAKESSFIAGAIPIAAILRSNLDDKGDCYAWLYTSAVRASSATDEKGVEMGMERVMRRRRAVMRGAAALAVVAAATLSSTVVAAEASGHLHRHSNQLSAVPNGRTDVIKA